MRTGMAAWEKHNILEEKWQVQYCQSKEWDQLMKMGKKNHKDWGEVTVSARRTFAACMKHSEVWGVLKSSETRLMVLGGIPEQE